MQLLSPAKEEEISREPIHLFKARLKVHLVNRLY